MRCLQPIGSHGECRTLVRQPVRLVGGNVLRRHADEAWLQGPRRTNPRPSLAAASAPSSTTAATTAATSAPGPAGTVGSEDAAAITTDGGAAGEGVVVRVLDERTAPEQLHDISTIILDCDGVLWRGSDIIRNAPEALKVFRRQGKRLLFVTNNSSKSRAEYAAKFLGLGLEVSPEEIVSSSYCAAAFLTSMGFGAGAGSGAPGRKVLLLGWTGVELELEAAGIPYVGGRNFPLPALDNLDTMKGLQVDPDIGAVVVGWDPHFSYSRLVYASICLRELPHCRTLVATNTDHADHIGAGRMMPGTGGLVAAVEVAAGVRAINVAKGGEWLLPYLCRTYGLDPARTAIIGDRLDTDIHLGRQGGLFTCLPLTGVTTLERLRQLRLDEHPDVVVQSIAQLAGLEV